jgi:hypothetical protein
MPTWKILRMGAVTVVRMGMVMGLGMVVGINVGMGIGPEIYLEMVTMVLGMEAGTVLRAVVREMGAVDAR